jgi:hypothetical protein
MTQKWNLQDIRPAAPRTPRAPMPQQGGAERVNISRPAYMQHEEMHQHRAPEPTLDIRDERQPLDDEDRIPVLNGNKKSRWQLITGVVVVLLVITTGIVIGIATGGAKITIHPKVREMNVNADFSAYTEKKPGELSYEVMTLDASGERQVKATGQSTTTKQATGEIEITKTTPGTQRLIKNTRFQTDTGLIFRIQESVLIPGSGKDASGKVVPGSIRAQVFADEAGDKYNLPVGTKLMVPGFKEGGETDLYNSIVATNPQAFTDGYSGLKFTINDGELQTAKQSLELELRNSLLEKMKAQRPADFTTFDSAVAITYTTLPPTQYGDNLVTLKEQALLQIPLFKNADFASYIASKTITGYDNEPVRIDNLQNLTFSYSNATTSQTNIANLTELNFKISGVPKIVWTFDGEKMKTELLGKDKTAFYTVIKDYTGIEKGEVEIKPFWKSSFPTDMKKITIIEDLSTAK